MSARLPFRIVDLDGSTIVQDDGVLDYSAVDGGGSGWIDLPPQSPVTEHLKHEPSGASIGFMTPDGRRWRAFIFGWAQMLSGRVTVHLADVHEHRTGVPA